MDYEQLRAGLSVAVPLNKHLGLEILEVADGRGVVRLPQDANLLNHVGSQHAAALFAAGEAASGAATVGALADRLGAITPLAASAEIRFLKIARGPITATGTVAESAQSIFQRLDADGRASFDANVSMQDEAGVTVAEMTVRWHASLRK